MEEESETCRITKQRVRRAVAQGDTESLFLDPTFIKSNLPNAEKCNAAKIAQRAKVAEEQQQTIEEVIAWFGQEIAAMKAAEANSNRRYSMWCAELINIKTRLRRQLTDKRTGAVAWEAYESEIVVLKCRAYARWRFFDAPMYGVPKELMGSSWERAIRKVLSS